MSIHQCEIRSPGDLVRRSGAVRWPAWPLALVVALWAFGAFTAAPTAARSAAAGAATTAKAAQRLAVGPGSTMRMLLEKTFLGFDVLTVTVQVDESTQKRLSALVRGRKYSEQLGARIALIGARLQNARARIVFARNLKLSQFLDAVKESLRLAQAAKLITARNRDTVSTGLPRWFGFLERRGIKKGDQIVYRVRPRSLQTRYIGVDGKVLLDQTDPGEDPRLALLGGYFAPGADFREGLVKSLFPR